MLMKLKESRLLKNHKLLLGNTRDKRKKIIKSTSPTPDLKRAVVKKQEGGTLFSIYNSIDPYVPPIIDLNTPKLKTEIVVNPIKKKQEKVIDKVKETVPESTSSENQELPVEDIAKKDSSLDSEIWKSPYTDRKKWIVDLTNAYKRAGITNDNAIKMLVSQDALESGWGRSAQGKFNFGNLTTGTKWKGNYIEGEDHDAKGNPIKQRFRAYNSMDEYAADKVQFLKRLYDFDENDDINRFTAKLTGANKGKRRYAEAKNYATSLINVYNKYEEGGKMQKSEEPLVKKALEFGQKTFEKMSPYDVRLIDFIKSKEGFRPKPERDKTDGKWTVGYGLTDPKLIRKYRNGITEEEASKHLIQHLQMGADSLVTMPYYDNLNLGEKTALNDLIYNIGWNKFKNSKRLQSHLKAGNDAGAKKEMNHGEHQARGLKIRRNQNRQMYDSTFNWKYKKGGVVKYQEPAQGIQKRDAVANYRPVIPLSPIKRIYTPTPQPVLSQDNKSKWQHEQAGEQADRGYNDYIESKKTQEGLNNLNGFLNFTDVMGLGTGIATLLGKGVKYAGKQAIKRGVKPLVTDKYLNIGNAMNTDANVINASNNFIEYLSQPETVQRLSSIDKELGTNYIKAVDQFKKDYKSGKIKLLVSDKWDNGKEVVSNNAVMPDFLEHPSYNNMVTTIVRTDPPHAVGHEYKHAIEYMQQFINNAPLTKEKFFKDFANSARLKKMFDADNIVSKEQFAKSYKAQYPMASDREIERYYDYLTKPTEFSSNLHPLIESNMIKGKPGVPNFKDVSELDDAVNNTYLSLPYNDPMKYTKIIYNHLIKDKERFRQVFNKYGYGMTAPVGISVINANSKYNVDK
jgi:GH24 family phage-related lysozyme (muramidase)/flagellum-specific peptidoglycan hydrolase FlgJ